MTKTFHNPDDEFDTLEQTVAQICPCAICASGGICDRAKKLTARIRSIKVTEPVTETAKDSTLNENFRLWRARYATMPGEQCCFVVGQDSFLAGAKAERELTAENIKQTQGMRGPNESYRRGFADALDYLGSRIKERDSG